MIRRRRWVVGSATVLVVAALVWTLLIVLTPVPAAIERSASPMLGESVIPGPLATLPPIRPRFDKTARSIDDPDSIWVVVNKRRPLDPLGYVPELVNAPVAHANPPGMRPEAAEALASMFAAAAGEGAGGMRLQSAYRSYEKQVRAYQYYVNTLGPKQADIASARAGHSEHQTGLTADISAGSSCILQECFADMVQGQWLTENAYRFGFLLRYPEGMTSITGYAFEPWHYRYIGVELATEMHEQGIATLEEFFDLPPAPTYD